MLLFLTTANTCFNNLLHTAINVYFPVLPFALKRPYKAFTPIPLEKFNFKTIVVASANDIWILPERAGFFAESWCGEVINIGNAGHINVSSGHTNWKERLDLLKKLG